MNAVDPAGDPYRSHEEAAALLEAGHAAAAEPLFRGALAGIEALDGPEHPDVANVLNGLAECLLALRRDAEAAELSRRAAAIAEQVLREHADELDAATATAVETILQEALGGLSVALRGQGRFAAAELPARRALDRTREHFGPGHALTGSRHNNLGVLYKYWGKLELARHHYAEALRISLADAEGDPLQLATIEYNLGGLAHAEGRFVPGETHLRRALERYLQHLREDHVDVAVCRMTLAALLDGQERFDESQELYAVALRTLEREYGPRHPDVALVLHNLGAIALARGELEEARGLLLRSLELREELLGRDHFQVGSTLRLLADVHQEEGDAATARTLRQRAGALHARVFGAAVDEREDVGLPAAEGFA